MTFHEENPFERDRTLIQVFLDRVKRYGQKTALLFYPSQGPKQYTSLSWNRWAYLVKNAALGLHSLGVRQGDRIGLLSENRPEWTVADLGALSLGAAVVPIYPTSSVQDVAYIVENAELEVLFVSCHEHLERLKPILFSNQKIRRVIVFDPVIQSAEKVMSLERLFELGRCEEMNNSDLYSQRISQVKPEDVATVIYTSGTTGPPKGVMLTHRNFICNYLAASERIRVSEEDIALSFLPLCHVFERLAGYYFMIFHGAIIAYAENMQTVPRDILAVKPTVAAAVPRFYEKIYAKITENVESFPPFKRKIFEWAMGAARQHAQNKTQRKKAGFVFSVFYFFAKALVLNKIKCQLGGRIRVFISGGAPLAKELAEFFYAAGVLILEGYGLTETSPVISVNAPDDFRFGTVGKPLSCAEVKIAEDGEILTRGPCVMAGYYKNEAATQEAIRDGWFYTGDIGAFDKDGFLKITDRKKDIIVTSGGKNIAPQNIENLLMSDRLFSQVVVIGDKRNYLVALIVPNRSEAERFARDHQLEYSSWAELLKHPLFYQWVEDRLRQRMQPLAAYEQIKHFCFLEKELSIESGDLTPTLKIKRKQVMSKYADLIEALYRRAAAPAPKLPEQLQRKP